MPAAKAETSQELRVARVHFQLINANTDKVIQEVRPGDRINLAALPTKRLNLRADFEGFSPDSVIFRLNGQSRYRNETAVPFSLAGDRAGDYNAWTPKVGTLSIEITPLVRGAKSKPTMINFEVVDDKKLLAAVEPKKGPKEPLGMLSPDLPITEQPAARPIAAAAAVVAAPAPAPEAALASASASTPATPEPKAGVNDSKPSSANSIVFELTPKQIALSPVESSASGKCVGIIDEQELALNVVCTHSVEKPVAAHLEYGKPNEVGDVVCDLGHPGSPVVKTCRLTDAQMRRLRLGDLYVQLDSASYPHGELRGRIPPEEIAAKSGLASKVKSTREKGKENASIGERNKK